MLARCRQHLIRALAARTLDTQRVLTRIPSQHYTQARENTVDQVRAQGIFRHHCRCVQGTYLCPTDAPAITLRRDA